MPAIATRSRRLLFGGLLTAVMMMAAGANAPATTPDQCGDADENGARTVTDGVRVLRTAAELSDGCAVASRCDIDGNGAVTVTDGVAALRLAAGLSVELACRNVVVDRSAFTLFSFDRRSAFGFCPPLGTLFHVFLTAGDDGVTFSASILVEGEPGDPACIADITTAPPVACAKEMDLPDRLLTAEELARVRNVFSSITREQQRNPDCARITFEPCLVNELVWDTSAITDFACGEPRLLADQTATLIAVLESLR